MPFKNLNQQNVRDVLDRWRSDIAFIAEEANFMAIDRIRYRAIDQWLVGRPPYRTRAHRNSLALGWIAKLWMTEGLMYVRRELDEQYGVVNLKRLLHEIEKRPEVLGTILPSEAAADRRTLERECRGALQFAQRQLAHRARWDDAHVSFRDLDAALDSIDHFAHKYFLAITGTEPKFQDLALDPDWLRAFTVAWYRPRRRSGTGEARANGKQRKARGR